VGACFWPEALAAQHKNSQKINSGKGRSICSGDWYSRGEYKKVMA
jgi:hypothetical protein